MEESVRNTYGSPILDMLRIAHIYGLFYDILRMVNGTHFFPKSIWTQRVWEKAWDIEDKDWALRS